MRQRLALASCSRLLIRLLSGGDREANNFKGYMMLTKSLLLSVVLSAVASPSLAQEKAQASGPQPVSRAVYLSRVDGAFASIDLNKDGFADRAEIEAAENKLIAARKAEALKQREAAFRQMDKDKNGSLSQGEFLAALEAQPQPKADGTRMLSRLDTNKDGKLNAAENRAPLAARFDRLDTNKDGILSTEEQRARRN